MKTQRIWHVVRTVGLALALVGTVPVRGDFLFGTPTPLGPTVNSYSSEYDPDISADGLSLFFQSNRPDGYGDSDLYVATRATTDDDWAEAINLGPYVNGPHKDFGPNISADGLSLYFNSTRPGGLGGADLYVITRESASEPWGTPMNLGPTVNSSLDEVSPCISSDGLSLYFSDWDQTGVPARPGGYGEADIWVTTRASLDDPWATPANLGAALNSSFMDAAPDVSRDGLTLFFSGYRNGSPWDLWVAVRDSVNDAWGAPLNLGPAVNSTTVDLNPTISADGRTLYFVSFRPGGLGNSDIWQVPVTPIVDFNGDGRVDGSDLAAVAAHWGQDAPSYDVAPAPLGDGVVDDRDLLVLSEYISKEIDDPTLVGCWTLDEAEGDIACDCAGGRDGTLVGGPSWQAAEGAVGGALEFDGIDDVVVTNFAWNPAGAPFSVFARIKGGRPGQVILSQSANADWLVADASEGTLMTGLKSTGRLRCDLYSDVVITDGRWHRVGLVWDGAERILYVDDVEVARDAQVNLATASSGLNIGAGKALEPGSLWSGLIDDVRIYSRAVKP